jgi:hypothetical protein
MALSTRTLERNGRGGPIGGGRGRDRRRPQSPPPRPWLIVMFSAPPRSILMEPVVGGDTHDPINTRHRLERARTAHRQKKEPKSLTPIVSRVPCDEFLFFVFLAEALKKHTVCPVVKKKVPPNSKVWVSMNSLISRASFLGIFVPRDWESRSKIAVQSRHPRP